MNTTVKGFTNKTIINQEAAQWILLLEDTPKLSKKQIEDLNAWVATSEVHRECLESMAQSWGEMDLLSEVMLPQEMRKPSLFPIILSYLLMPIFALFTTLSIARKNLLRPIVATPLILTGLMVIVFITQPINTNNNIVLTTKIGENKSHIMPDGSTLWLNSSTKIEVYYSDAFRRIKLLTGEAHFEVAKDASRPFEVYANDRLVRAIGTAFSVHKVDGNIEVIVSEGTVELAVIDNTLVVIPDDFQNITIENNINNRSNNRSNNKQLNSVQEEVVPQPAKVKQILGKLTAGQRISIPVEYEKISDVIELDTSEVTRSLSWKEGKLVFAGESLEDVIQEITRHTKVKIDVLDPQLKSMRIGGQFQVGETDTLFYVLESGFGISVNKLNDLHVQLRLKEK